MKDERTILIEEMVRRLDRYLFNFEVALCGLQGNEIVRPPKDETFGLANPLITSRQRAALNLGCTIQDEITAALPEAKRPLVSRLDAAHLEYTMASEDVARLLGLIMGLRLAGMSPDDAKRMATTWAWSSGLHESEVAADQLGDDSRAQ